MTTNDKSENGNRCVQSDLTIPNEMQDERSTLPGKLAPIAQLPKDDFDPRCWEEVLDDLNSHCVRVLESIETWRRGESGHSLLLQFEDSVSEVSWAISQLFDYDNEEAKTDDWLFNDDTNDIDDDEDHVEDEE